MKWMTYAVVLCALAGLGIGAVWDYALSDWLYEPQQPLAVFMEDGIPLLLKLWFVGCFALLGKDRPWPCWLAAAVAAVLFAMDAIRIIHGQNTILALLGWSGSALFGGWLLQQSVSPVWYRRLRPYLILFLLVFFTAMLLTTLLKVLWGRIRYRQMSDPASFCVWYLPCGKGGRSFPSGHTCSFASTLLCLLSTRSHYHKRPALWLCIVVFAAILWMALSRMIMGAHFLSDTMAALLIAYGCWRFYEKRMKEFLYEDA